MSEDYTFELPERELIIEELLLNSPPLHEDEELDEYMKHEFRHSLGG